MSEETMESKSELPEGGELSLIRSRMSKAEVQIDGLETKAKASHDLIQKVVMYSHGVDDKMNVLVEMLEEKGVLERGALESLLDTRRGLRTKEATELIEAGDVAWVTYKALIPGEPKPIGEVNLPVRVGAGAIVFDKELIGKNPHQTISYSDEFKDKGHPQWLGKRVDFTINIGQVKTKIGEQSGSATTH